jgi:mutator family transposase
VACFEDDFEACIAHLRLPIGHRRAIRTTNLLERMFGDERRRTKIIPHSFGEKAVMKLMYAALMRARQGWRNVVITSFEVKQIQSLRDHLNKEFEQRHASPLKSASRSRIHSTDQTWPTATVGQRTAAWRRNYAPTTLPRMIHADTRLQPDSQGFHSARRVGQFRSLSAFRD